MAYNSEKLVKLEALEDLARRVKGKIPTKVSELSNDSKYQTETEVKVAVQTAIAEAGHARYEKADAVPTVEGAKENVLYLVRNEQTGHYDIYALVGGSVELLDDTTVNLSGYTTTEEIEAMFAEKVAGAEEVSEMLTAVFDEPQAEV